jgi:hypothetical protein
MLIFFCGAGKHWNILAVIVSFMQFFLPWPRRHSFWAGGWKIISKMD